MQEAARRLSSSVLLASASQNSLGCRSFSALRYKIDVAVEGVQPPLYVPNKSALRETAEAIPAQSLRDAISMVRSLYSDQKKRCLASPKISQGFDIGIRLGIDPRRGDHNVRGVVSLPHGTGKKLFVAVFTSGVREAEAAREAGADLVGGEELIERILEEPEATIAPFQSCVASPEMISKLSRVAKILGPRGLMPNPKAGTLTPDVARAVREVKRGRVEYRVDRGAWVMRCVGKAEFTDAHLTENVLSFAGAVALAKPDAFQGSLSRFFVDAFVKTTCTPRVPVRPDSLLDELRDAKLITN